MKQGEEQKVTVRISANASDELALELSPRNGVSIKNQITVSPYMSVKLEGDEAFKIVALTPEDQFVAKDKFTQWQFRVKAQDSGEHELDLLVGVREIGSGRQEVRFNPTYEQKVIIEVDRTYVLVRFWNENWKYILGTLLLPVAWFYVKRRWGEKKDKKEEPDDEKEGETKDPEDADDGKGDE
jgi:hypothetical protein